MEIDCKELVDLLKALKEKEERFYSNDVNYLNFKEKAEKVKKSWIGEHARNLIDMSKSGDSASLPDKGYIIFMALLVAEYDGILTPEEYNETMDKGKDVVTHETIGKYFELLDKSVFEE